jgi:hypothetical protein
VTDAAPRSAGPSPTSTPPYPSSALAAFDTIVSALADGEFDRIASVVADDASLTALLPRGLHRCDGAPAICQTFAGWFGGLDDLEVIDHGYAPLGDLVQMRWRLHARGARLGDGPRVVEQQVFAGLGADGRIQSMSLLCSGFRAEPTDG